MVLETGRDATYIIRDFDHKVKAIRNVKVRQRLYTPMNGVMSCTVVLEAAEELSNEENSVENRNCMSVELLQM